MIGVIIYVEKFLEGTHFRFFPDYPILTQLYNLNNTYERFSFDLILQTDSSNIVPDFLSAIRFAVEEVLSNIRVADSNEWSLKLRDKVRTHTHKM